MRFFMRSLALLLAMPLTLSPTAAETWQAVKTEGLGFKIEMPGDPKVEEQDVDLGDGKSAKMRTIQILSPQAIYDVTIADYPAGMAQSIGTDTVLDRLYNIGAITKDGGERSADIEKYFRSFTIDGAGSAAKP